MREPDVYSVQCSTAMILSLTQSRVTMIRLVLDLDEKRKEIFARLVYEYTTGVSVLTDMIATCILYIERGRSCYHMV